MRMDDNMRMRDIETFHITDISRSKCTRIGSTTQLIQIPLKLNLNMFSYGKCTKISNKIKQFQFLPSEILGSDLLKKILLFEILGQIH